MIAEKEIKLLPLEHFEQMLSYFHESKPSDSQKETLFLENLRFGFPLTEMPDDASMKTFFITSYESRPFAFKTKWINEEIILLVWAVYNMTDRKGVNMNSLNEDDWGKIALLFQDRSAKQCMFKYLNLLRSNPIKKENKWTRQEDEILLEIANGFQDKKLKFKWTRIANELYERCGRIHIRMGKHCRERWNNHLNPLLNKGKWSSQEDLILLRNVGQKGRKWAKISRFLPGRNEYAVKNRFYFLMKKYHINPNSKNLCQDVRSLIRAGLNPSNLGSLSPDGSPKLMNSMENEEDLKDKESSPLLNSAPIEKVEFETIQIKEEEKEKELTPDQKELFKKYIENNKQVHSPNPIEENEKKKRELFLLNMNYMNALQRNNMMMMGMNPMTLGLMNFRQQQMQLLWMNQMYERMALLNNLGKK